MANQDHLNVDAGAQGGDNEDQSTQAGGAAPTGMSAGPIRTGGVGSATAGLIPSNGGSGNASGTVIGDNNTAPTFAGSAVGSDTAQDRDQGAGDAADTKSDQSDYSATTANDGLLASSSDSGRAEGVTGGGSVENAAISQGDVLRGAGAGTGAATGSRDNAAGAMSNDYTGTEGNTDGTSISPQGGSGDVPAAPNPDAMP